MLPPCSGLSRRGLETPQSACVTESRPALTAPARGGLRDLRSGRKKACGAVEQKKGRKEGGALEAHRALTGLSGRPEFVEQVELMIGIVIMSAHSVTPQD
jgi:hypothetical protein